MSPEVPQRGDFVVLNFNPQSGPEQAERRIGIVLSPQKFNESTGFAVLCPVTNQKKKYPYEVDLPQKGLSLDDGGAPVTGVILTDQVKSLDWSARNLKILKKYNPEDKQIEIIDDIIEECFAKIETFLTLS